MIHQDIRIPFRTSEVDLQICLIHVQRLFQVSAEGSDEHLVDLVFHDNVGQPPTLRPLNTVSEKKKMFVILLMYGSVTNLLPFVLARRCCCTLEGETEAATLACWDARAFWTAGGRAVPDGKLRPSAHRTRMASKPDLALCPLLPSGLPGVGVVERPSSDRRLVTEDFLLRPSFQDIVRDCATRATSVEG